MPCQSGSIRIRPTVKGTRQNNPRNTALDTRTVMAFSPRFCSTGKNGNVAG